MSEFLETVVFNILEQKATSIFQVLEMSTGSPIAQCSAVSAVATS